MMNLSGLMPSPITIAGIVGLLWIISSRSVRQFLWADLRGQMLDLRALPRNSRWLARAGLVLLGLLVVTLIFGDVWRQASPLVALTGARTFRGELLPTGLLPLTLFLLVCAWSFVLTGALHSHWPVRLLFLLVYELNAISWAESVVGSADRRELWLVVAGIVGVAMIFAVRWRAGARPVLEFSALFVCVAIVFLLAQNRELQNQQLYGIPTGLAKINFNVNFLGGLITPLLLLIGMEIASFVRRISHWAGEILTVRSPRVVASLALAALLAWRLFFIIRATAEHGTTVPMADHLYGLLGSFGEVAMVAFAWWMTGLFVREIPDEETTAEEVEPWARPLVLTYSAVQLTTFVLLLSILAFSGQRMEWLHGILSQLVQWLTHFTTPWHFLFSAGALGLSVFFARRRARGIALYLGIVGALHLWWGLTSPGNALAILHGRSNDGVELCWVTVFTLVTVWWLVRRELSAGRVSRLVVLLLIVSLMRNREFIENPFSPFFGLAGVIFIAFTLVWHVATSGSWTNAETPRMPRVSRVFLYLGAILLTATVLNWAVTIHDLNTVEKLTGGTALAGFDLFGKPLLYATFAVALALPAAAAVEESTHHQHSHPAA
ncbi:MAG: hypothetical protein M3Y86_08965 [Verrucomicrobiota bacterium]|nr:hypothetical protein [Verrucomicrobiota bacterium]